MSTIKKILACILSLALLLSVSTALSAFAEGEDEENYDTGDASLDDPRNQDGIGEKELLVVSFGTSFNDSRRLTIGAIEKRPAGGLSRLERPPRLHKPDHHRPCGEARRGDHRQCARRP